VVCVVCVVCVCARVCVLVCLCGVCACACACLCACVVCVCVPACVCVCLLLCVCLSALFRALCVRACVRAHACGVYVYEVRSCFDWCEGITCGECATHRLASIEGVARQPKLLWVVRGSEHTALKQPVRMGSYGPGPDWIWRMRCGWGLADEVWIGSGG
jgi:hypothetical protein